MVPRQETMKVVGLLLQAGVYCDGHERGGLLLLSTDRGRIPNHGQKTTGQKYTKMVFLWRNLKSPDYVFYFIVLDSG